MTTNKLITEWAGDYTRPITASLLRKLLKVAPLIEIGVAYTSNDMAYVIVSKNAAIRLLHGVADDTEIAAVVCPDGTVRIG